jgi:hypothetical protein
MITTIWQRLQHLPRSFMRELQMPHQTVAQLTLKQ